MNMIQKTIGTLQDSEIVRKVIGRDYSGGPVDFYTEKTREFDPDEKVYCTINDNGVTEKVLCGQVKSKQEDYIFFENSNANGSFEYIGFKLSGNTIKDVIAATSEHDAEAAVNPACMEQDAIKNNADYVRIDSLVEKHTFGRHVNPKMTRILKEPIVSLGIEFEEHYGAVPTDGNAILVDRDTEENFNEYNNKNNRDS